LFAAFSCGARAKPRNSTKRASDGFDGVLSSRWAAPRAGGSSRPTRLVSQRGTAGGTRALPRVGPKARYTTPGRWNWRTLSGTQATPRPADTKLTMVCIWITS
jgi:hypothetical protein